MEVQDIVQVVVVMEVYILEMLVHVLAKHTLVMVHMMDIVYVTLDVMVEFMSFYVVDIEQVHIKGGSMTGAVYDRKVKDKKGGGIDN